LSSLVLLQGAAPPSDSPLIGIWYGKGQPDDPDILYLDFFGSDGSFVSEFRKYDGCTIVWQQVESGTWSIAGDVQTIMKSSVNGRPASAEQEYVIESATAREIRARHTGTGYLFVEHRMERFEFPVCNVGV
jgi:hypothetical protein